ncbi:hypothetical protein CR513_00772, partial [Mucuna pruriens]
TFLKEVLLKDVHNYKGMEFLKLKKGNRVVVDFAIKILDNDNNVRIVHFKKYGPYEEHEV